VHFDVDRRVIGYLVTLATVAVTFLVVGLLQAQVGGLPSAMLLYLVPIILAASRWGRGPAIAAAVVSILGHDLLFTAPRGSFVISEVYDAVGLALLLFTAVVTAQFADTARRSA
jgi:two-component system sensor histidine kinase KdpD